MRRQEVTVRELGGVMGPIWKSYYTNCRALIVSKAVIMDAEGHLKRHSWALNTMRPRQNGRHFADDTFNRIFVNENVRISNNFSLKFVPKGPINHIPTLVQIMAWRRSGDKPLSESMLVSLPTHICVTRPQWVNSLSPGRYDSISQGIIFKLIIQTVPWELVLVKLLHMYDKTSLKINQHWFRQWLVAFR